MRKLWVLAWKEVRLAFRDVGAIVTMLVTPLALTLAIAAAFGGGGGGNLADIPVLILNQDRGTFSQDLVDVFSRPEVSGLVAPELVTDEVAARARVEADEVAALIVIPPDFSDRVFPQGAQLEERLGLDLTALTQEQVDALSLEQKMALGRLFAGGAGPVDDPVIVEIYASPQRQISTAVVKGIVTQGLEIMNIKMRGIQAIMTRIVQGQLAAGVDPAENAAGLGVEGTGAALPDAESELPVRLQVVSPSGRPFSWLDYSAASMSILFLMFAVTSGGRTLLAERAGGTLPRLLVSPTPALTVLVGKMAGIVLTGLLQVGVLWGATSLVGAYWGAPLGVVAGICVLVLCASGVGALVSAWAKTPGQAGAIGTAVTLVGAALSGSFFPRANLPTWVQQLSLVTPQAWGIEIFSRLQLGRGLESILPWLGGALLLTVGYYVIALFGFRRQFE